ncbi:MAG: hypothetical protein A3H57_04500 [Candidatus Taylorbacteria bacterium RIFCSPLOWO2_02_FULL_43_11]|uniref:Uncharacterized protein n=1 Tax=Candidatus Taylorbacteria bacterium RIFCSPHIGHO2_02_FULL_43_32b TaxID=1802306 RepID=A0A1G2MME1_9BACT|nr:MAG: hypothetical protein A3C72_01180 [Candidatus Taylorbacteria bacterium RIFCSPHIGHO2_02_FULL_43_32b]OHA32025.1 MAG: hypothetical protein A3B08_03170 [Candidatus Taylorbacteria bacterium RIFCSPLOWO2_01_FULL_43_44]OHA37569.1 MAG: hypothetical protein A3H57_04500 [Candidatus Taylorbacteria bacterium RIFCSPLOWO2_02_FULL_43_11]
MSTKAHGEKGNINCVGLVASLAFSPILEKKLRNLQALVFLFGKHGYFSGEKFLVFGSGTNKNTHGRACLGAGSKKIHLGYL